MRRARQQQQQLLPEAPDLVKRGERYCCVHGTTSGSSLFLFYWRSLGPESCVPSGQWGEERLPAIEPLFSFSFSSVRRWIIAVIVSQVALQRGEKGAGTAAVCVSVCLSSFCSLLQPQTERKRQALYLGARLFCAQQHTQKGSRGVRKS